MKEVVSISLGSRKQDFEFSTVFLGQSLKVRRLGTDGSLAKAEKLLKLWERRADVIGLGVLKDDYRAGSHRFVDDDSVRLKLSLIHI